MMSGRSAPAPRRRTVLKLLAGSFLAFLAIENLVPLQKADEPTQMYLVGFQYVFYSPPLALAFTGAFVIISHRLARPGSLFKKVCNTS